MDSEFLFLIKRCIKNDRRAQQKLYETYYSYGMGISIRYIKDENEAIEILNDSFLKVFNNLKKFDSSKNFKPWFRKIVVNTALTHMKKNKKLKMQLQIDDAIHVSSREDILSKIGYSELINLVQSLSTAYRTVFNMYVIDGYKHNEISETLGISVGTSKSNLSKARAILQNKIISQLDLHHG